MEYVFYRVNDATQPNYLGWVQVQADLRIDFYSGIDYQSIQAYLYRGHDTSNCVATKRLNFTEGTIKLGINYDSASITKSHFYLDETPDGIYLVVKMGPATDHQNDYQTIVGEGYIVNKFQWQVMLRRFEKFARVTIQDIIDSMQYMKQGSYMLKNTNIEPIIWGRGIQNKVKVVNEANPDGVIICADGNVITPDVFDILDTWSEKDQDLFLLKTFTNLKS